jgi:hypothetical protein
MDRLAVLGPVEIEVQLGDWLFTVPVYGAARWIAAIQTGLTQDVLPDLLLPEDQLELWRSYRDGQVDADEMRAAARQLIAEAGGRDWWEVERLVVACLDDEIRDVVFGEMALRSIDLDEVSLAGFLSAVVSLARRNSTPEQWIKFEAELTAPPSEVGIDELIDEEQEAAAFERHLGMMG